MTSWWCSAMSRTGRPRGHVHPKYMRGREFARDKALLGSVKAVAEKHRVSHQCVSEAISRYWAARAEHPEWTPGPAVPTEEP